mgnify:CR=1 FL=1
MLGRLGSGRSRTLARSSELFPYVRACVPRMLFGCSTDVVCLPLGASVPQVDHLAHLIMLRKPSSFLVL